MILPRLPRAARLVACGLLFSLGASVAIATSIADIFQRNDAENARISAEAKQKLAASSARREALQAAQSTTAAAPPPAFVGPTTPREEAVYKYDYVGAFHDDRARVRLQDTWGFIDPTGREVVPLQYDYADDFRDGLTVVGKNEQWGVIDPTGAIVIPLEHRGTDLKLVGHGIVRVRKDKKVALLDRRGQPLTSQLFDGADGEFSEGLVRVTLEGKDGFIDARGNIVIHPHYDFAEKFKDGLSKVSSADWKRHGFIDREGREVIPPIYPEAGEFSEGLVALFQDTADAVQTPGRPVNQRIRLGFADRTGRIVLPFEYRPVLGDFGVTVHTLFSDGLAALRLPSGKNAFIDRNGQVVIGGDFDTIAPFQDGLAIVGRFNRGESNFLLGYRAYHFSLINPHGKPVSSREYDEIRPFAEGLAAVVIDRRLNLESVEMLRGENYLNPGKWGFINRAGEAVITPQYHGARDFHHGYAAVNLGAQVDKRAFVATPEGGKWGLINTNGEVVVPIRFDRISDVNPEGKVTVTQGRQSQTYSLNGLADMQRGLAAMQAQNPAEALRLFGVAAREGNATAVGNLGLMHLRGMGVPQNPTEGMKWITWAARRGDAQSMFNLGLFYAETNRRDQSRDWLQKAQAAGHPQAKAALAQLERMGGPAPSQPAPPPRERERERTR